MNISDALRTMHGVMPNITAEAPVQAQVSGSTALDQLPLAMAYVPMQAWGETYEGLQALDVGTIFPDLNLPFCGRRRSE